MRSIICAALLSLTPAGVALAQAVGVPPIEQEPRPGVVQEREAARGLTPSARQNQRQQQEVDQLYQELTGQNPNAPTSAMPPPAGPPLSREAGSTDQLYRELTGQNPNAPLTPLPPQPPPPSGGQVNQLYRDMTGQNPSTTR